MAGFFRRVGNFIQSSADRVMNVVMTPLTSWRTSSKVSSGVQAEILEQARTETAEAIGASTETVMGSIATSTALTAAEISGHAPSRSQRRAIGRIAGAETAAAVTEGNYSNREELQQLVQTRVSRALLSSANSFNDRDNFVFDAASLNKVAEGVARQIANNFDKLPGSVVREAARRAETDGPSVPTPAPAPARTNAVAANRDNDMELGNLPTPVIGRATSRNVGLG